MISKEKERKEKKRYNVCENIEVVKVTIVYFK